MSNYHCGQPLSHSTPRGNMLLSDVIDGATSAPRTLMEYARLRAAGLIDTPR